MSVTPCSRFRLNSQASGEEEVQLSEADKQLAALLMQEEGKAIKNADVSGASAAALAIANSAAAKEKFADEQSTSTNAVPPGITIRPALPADVQELTNLVNQAFLEEDSLKKPEHAGRLKFEEIRAMIEEEEDGAHSAVQFLVAEEQGEERLISAVVGSGPTRRVVGCVLVYLPQDVLTREALESAQSAKPSVDVPNLMAALSMLAVLPEFRSRGIGSLLIKAADEFLAEEASCASEYLQPLTSVLHNQTMRIIVPVINGAPYSKRLFAFYSRNGYQSLNKRNEEPEQHPDFTSQLKDEWKDVIRLHMLFKDLAWKPRS
eukprot:gnl/MRDRNA2_/MRDRNA2_257646_c0_seq1.p1 gnl/MRDRNA2_/MRDRNA2_257646_c0~~gnl/MRDRNA2_/MRDRNA2_257646_c0_seq1.p1  ORF type:complete len:365 (+),score=78.62 gnl/MRDRNA2_/MRDRNA2_257646_c0_seq1:141-1097(+)